MYQRLQKSCTKPGDITIITILQVILRVLTIKQEQEDWMILCQLHQDLNVISNRPYNVDWAEYSEALPPATVRQVAKWIKTTKISTPNTTL